MLSATEIVTVQRTAARLTAWVDPLEHRLYLDDASTDVRAGDVLALRNTTRRVTSEPQVWTGAGLVVLYEAASALLPDLGQVLRGSGAPVLDEDTGELTVPGSTSHWTGPCLVEPAQSDGLTPELGEQRVGIVPFLVTVPLALVDVRSGDQFRITQSRDARLTTRLLTITGVRASSSSLVRQLVAFDNQGG